MKMPALAAVVIVSLGLVRLMLGAGSASPAAYMGASSSTPIVQGYQGPKPLVPGPGPVARIYISPGYIGLPVGAKQQLRVLGVDAGGSEVPVPGRVSWTARRPAGSIGPGGVFEASKKAGLYDHAVTARLPNGMTATAIVEVFDLKPEGGYRLDRMWGSKAPGQFNHPQAVAVDNQAYVYVADTNNHRIQKFDASGQYLSSFGRYGDGAGEFLFPVSIAVDKDRSIYVVDRGTNRVQKLNRQGRLLMQLKGTGSRGSALRKPSCVAVDGNGNLYIGDLRASAGDPESSCVLKCDPSGKILARLRPDPEVFNGAFMDISGITVSKERVYVTDRDQNRLVIFSTEGKCLRAIRIDQALGVAAASDGSIYVIRHAGHTVVKLNSEGQEVGTLQCSHTDGASLFGPSAVAVSRKGDVYVAEQVFNGVHKFDASGKCVARWGTCDKGQFLYVHGLATDARGDVYATDAVRGRVQKFDSSGNCLTWWGSNVYAAEPLHGAHGITVDGRGYVYVTTGARNRIEVFDSCGKSVSRWSTGSGVDSANWVAADSDSNVYVSFHKPRGVVKYDCAGVRLGLFTAKAADSFSYGTPMTVSPQGRVYYSDDGMLFGFEADGTAITEVSPVKGTGGLATDGGGNLYAIWRGGRRIGKFDQHLKLLSEWGSAGGGPGQFDQPRGLAVSPDGSIYVADFVNTRILKYVPAVVRANSNQ